MPNIHETIKQLSIEAGGPGSGRKPGFGTYKKVSEGKDKDNGFHTSYSAGPDAVRVIDNNKAKAGVASARGKVVVIHQTHTEDESVDHSRKTFSNKNDAGVHLELTYGIHHQFNRGRS